MRGNIFLGLVWCRKAVKCFVAKMWHEGNFFFAAATAASCAAGTAVAGISHNLATLFFGLHKSGDRKKEEHIGSCEGVRELLLGFPRRR